VGFFLLGSGEPASPPAVSIPPPAAPVLRPPSRVVMVPVDEPPPGEAAPPPTAEPSLDPDAYPYEVPAWWEAADRRFRDTPVRIEGTTLRFIEILALLEKEVGFPVRVGPELERWAAEQPFSIPSAAGPARALVEVLALRNNLEVVIEREALVFHQRGRAPDTREVRAGRVQSAILEAGERRRGIRGEDRRAGEVRERSVDLGFDGVPLRDAAKEIGARAGIPVYLDRTMWKANPRVTVAAGQRTLGALLDAVVGPLEAAADVTPTRIVILRSP